MGAVRELGPHRVMAGDAAQDDWSPLLDRPVAAVYTDPPWGPGKLTYFSRLAGAEPRLTWPEFRRRLVERIVAVRPRWIFVEMGRQWAVEWSSELIGAGAVVRAAWPVLYRSGAAWRASELIWAGDPLRVDGSPSGLRGSEVVRWALTAVRAGAGAGAVVLDPCAGRGLVMRQAHQLGLRFRGIELNPARLDSGVRQLQALGGA